jgi:hypothetical protein
VYKYLPENETEVYPAELLDVDEEMENGELLVTYNPI